MAAPTIYYVDTVNGNDGNAGTSMGAAWQTLKHAIETGVTQDATNGDRIRIYAPVGTPDAYVSGDPAIDLQGYAATATATAPLIIEGCDATGTSRATAYITCAGRYLFNDTAFDHLKAIDLDITGGSASGIWRTDTWTMLIRCAVRQTSTGKNLSVTGSGSTLVNCAFIGAGANQYILECLSSTGTVIGCLMKETTNACYGVQGPAIFIGNIVHLNTTHPSSGYGVSGAGLAYVFNNFLLNSGAGVASGISSTAAGARLLNNYIEGWSGSGGDPWTLTGSNTELVAGNRWYNCSDAPTATDAAFEYDNSSLGASGVTDLSGGDYTPLAALRAAGFPASLLTLSLDTNISIGAVQNALSASGGLLRHPGMSGGIVG